MIRRGTHPKGNPSTKSPATRADRLYPLTSHANSTYHASCHVSDSRLSRCLRIRIPRERRDKLQYRASSKAVMKFTSFIFIFSLFLFFFFHLGFCFREECIAMATTLGGKSDSSCDGTRNSAEVEELARFAVKEHNKKENALLEFEKVVKAEEQVVTGILHHITVEVIDAGKKKLYEAKVWVKPWLEFKKLQEFKHVGDSPSFTRSDLGVKKDEQGSGWKQVPTHDPAVRDAANHAVKTIHQRSNTLFPYELVDILRAKAEVVEDLAKFELFLKVKRGSKEEKFLVEVHKNMEGTFHLNKMQQERSETDN